MTRRARGAALLLALVCAGGCASVLGIEQPNVVGDDGGSNDSTTLTDVVIEGGDAGQCSAGQVRCSDNGVETCRGGQWGSAVACGSGSCTAGACSGPCTQGAVQCSGNGLQSCGANGMWGAPTACVNETCATGGDGGAACTGICAPGQTHPIACGNCGINTQTCNASGAWQDGTCMSATPACTPNATQCQGSAVQTCSSCGQWVNAVACLGSTPFCANNLCSAEPPSCTPGGAGMTNCGSSGAASCCATLEVPGGTYDRSYDGLTSLDAGNPATVTGFNLDKYEVTVGRFRQFLKATVGGWGPAAGAGKHTHLNGGSGLGASGGGFETGWDSGWNMYLVDLANGWQNINVGCAGPTWTPTAGSNENLPIQCESWFEAYAFCIWDGGFLPSEAEWNYAAAGGSEQRAFPWSPAYPPGSNASSCANANYYPCSAGPNPIAVGSESPAGDGKWGHTDLAGNAQEWTIDWFAYYPNPCTDCFSSNGNGLSRRVVRGGAFDDGLNDAGVSYMNTSFRFLDDPARRIYFETGVRCARTP